MRNRFPAGKRWIRIFLEAWLKQLLEEISQKE